jgi:hypothetical protein
MMDEANGNEALEKLYRSSISKILGFTHQPGLDAGQFR